MVNTIYWIQMFWFSYFLPNDKHALIRWKNNKVCLGGAGTLSAKLYDSTHSGGWVFLDFVVCPMWARPIGIHKLV